MGERPARKERGTDHMEIEVTQGIHFLTVLEALFLQGPGRQEDNIG